MIPETLNDWNIDKLKKIIELGYFENIAFDFKEKLPHSSDDKSKMRLYKSCCAFANQNGGFLIFGVKDDKGLTMEERLVGIDSSIDFPEHFGNFPKKGTPLIEWNFLNPALVLENGNKIHIAHILPSRAGPIAFNEDDKWFFFIRTNKGNQAMTYEEIKNDFVNIYEKRLKLNLLDSELQIINETAQGLRTSDTENTTQYSLLKFNLDIVRSVLQDTYSILADESDLLHSINLLKAKCDVINNKIDIFWTTVNLPMTNRQLSIKAHNSFVNEHIDDIQKYATNCKLHLSTIKSKY